jgi:hypothetical protein
VLIQFPLIAMWHKADGWDLLGVVEILILALSLCAFFDGLKMGMHYRGQSRHRGVAPEE